jgi:branched-chain amino acid transport system ATP-binding protein
MTGASAPPLLAVQGLSVRFGGLVALDGVTLDVIAGEVLGVIGPNGAGKTTLFNVVCGFVPATEGTLSFEGHPLGRVRTSQLARLGIARTLQGLGLFPHLTVRDNVRVGAHVHRRAGFTSALLGLPRSDTDEAALSERAAAALVTVGIADVADRLPGSLPYPQQKKVALARALVFRPRLLLLDEPASGLGPQDLIELAGLIRALRPETTVVLVEHHMDLVMEVSDRVAVLDFGRLVACGTPAAVRADPAVVDAYLGRPAGSGGGEAPADA